jgi:hypothetical protein
MVKEVMTFELEKSQRQPPLLAEDLAHRHLRVVIILFPARICARLLGYL